MENWDRKREKTGMIETYLLDSSTLPDPLAHSGGMAGFLLPKERVEKIHRIRHLDARKQCFGAGLLLNYALKQACGIKQAAGIRYNPWGMPYLDPVPFNLSHTGRYVIISIWNAKRQREAGGVSLHCAQDAQPAEESMPQDGICIGCDIEQIKAYRQKTARRFFTQTEYACLEAADEQLQAEWFCRYWTRKESVMKMTGLGMELPMDLFDISTSGRLRADRKKVMEWQAALKERHRPEHGRAARLLLEERVFFKEYSYDGCCITVCSTMGQYASGIYPVGNRQLRNI